MAVNFLCAKNEQGSELKMKLNAWRYYDKIKILKGSNSLICLVTLNTGRLDQTGALARKLQ